MKRKFVTLMTAVAAAGLCGASVWAAEDPAGADQSSQSGQAGQYGQQGGQQGQGGQAGQWSGNPEQAKEAMTEAIQRIGADPKEFLQRAYQNNLTAIQLGQLAEQKGQSPQIKEFGQHLVQGHQALNDKITQLASQKNITLEKKLDTPHQMMVDRLSGLSGAEFDKHFINQQVNTHRRDVALYQAAADKNTDPDVKSFAKSSVPALREHLQMAQTQASTINEAAGAQPGQQGQQGQQQSPQGQPGEQGGQQQQPQSPSGGQPQPQQEQQQPQSQPQSQPQQQ